jgi:hypothetical protein
MQVAGTAISGGVKVWPLDPWYREIAGVARKALLGRREYLSGRRHFLLSLAIAGFHRAAAGVTWNCGPARAIGSRKRRARSPSQPAPPRGPRFSAPSAVSAATGFKSMLHNALHRRRKMRVSAVRFSVCAERFEAPNRVSAESPQRAAVFSGVVPRILAILSRRTRFGIALRQSAIVYFENRPMADALIENLILNPPFVEPNRHFNLPTRGAPTRLSPANALIQIER